MYGNKHASLLYKIESFAQKIRKEVVENESFSTSFAISNWIQTKKMERLYFSIAATKSCKTN